MDALLSLRALRRGLETAEDTRTHTRVLQRSGFRVQSTVFVRVFVSRGYTMPHTLSATLRDAYMYATPIYMYHVRRKCVPIWMEGGRRGWLGSLDSLIYLTHGSLYAFQKRLRSQI